MRRYPAGKYATVDRKTGDEWCGREAPAPLHKIDNAAFFILYG
jgi:hypothetical protein